MGGTRVETVSRWHLKSGAGSRQMTGGQTDGAAQPCHTFHQGSLDRTLCSKGSSQAGGPLVAVEDLVEGVFPALHLPWRSGVLSADRSCQRRLAGPLSQASSRRNSWTSNSLYRRHSPQPRGGEPGQGQRGPRLWPGHRTPLSLSIWPGEWRC